MPIDLLIFAGVTYCDGRKRESDSNIIFRGSFIGYFFLGFHIVTTGNVFLWLTLAYIWKSSYTDVLASFTSAIRRIRRTIVRTLLVYCVTLWVSFCVQVGILKMGKEIFVNFTLIFESIIWGHCPRFVTLKWILIN
jgi:hypothetical protein